MRAHSSRGMTYSDFVDDAKTVRAVERNITIIGEAARNVPDEIRQRFPDVPWADMVGMRNFVAHAYFRVSHEIVWKTVTAVIPRTLAIHLRVFATVGSK